MCVGDGIYEHRRRISTAASNRFTGRAAAAALSLLLPVWLEKNRGKWSAFGGAGCELNRGGGSRNFCETGFAVTNQIRKDLQLGVEIFHQTADTIGGQDTTSVGTGIRYDLNEHFHLLGYIGRGIQNASDTDRLNWYSSVLFTF